MHTKEKTYKRAYTELNEVIKVLSENEKSKIPSNFLKKLDDNIDDKYKFKLDMSKGIFEQNLMPETRALIIELYERFLAKKEEKEFWQKYDELCLKKIENQKKEKYNPEVLFKSKEYSIKKTAENVSTSITVLPKENIFKKIINKIKRIFG